MFIKQYGNQLEDAYEERTFKEFETVIDAMRKSYNSRKDQINLEILDHEVNELKDVLVKNVADIIDRGEKLDSLLIIYIYLFVSAFYDFIFYRYSTTCNIFG